MPRLDDVPEGLVKLLGSLPLPDFDSAPFVTGKPLSERRVALLTTAGLVRRGEPVFEPYATDHRAIPGDIEAADLLLSHLSVNFDRSGFQQDVNVVLPLERLRELVQEGEIGSLADFHYSLPGGTDPRELEDVTSSIAEWLARDGVDTVLGVPV
jgi:D-proline reductase (dithiol) PrdB